MAYDRHVGRDSPTFVVKGHPDTFINLINRHGILTRLQRSRKCPCSANTGSPNLFCKICHGDGFVIDFQRKLLQADEDSDAYLDTVSPFRIPILEVLSVERLMPDEQGGIIKYNVNSYDSSQIKISGDPLPLPWMRMRVSYFFDRYIYANDDVLQVDVNSRTLKTTATLFNDEHSSGNVVRANGDIALINKLWNFQTGYEYTDYNFYGDEIYLNNSEPEPVPGFIKANYYYVPPSRVLVADLDNKYDMDKWETMLKSGIVRMSVEPWYELTQGDLITVLSSEFYKEQIIAHSLTGIDKLVEFEVTRISDEIFDQNGSKYYKGTDYFLRRKREISWIGNQPAPGSNYSLRYSYHPVYRIFQDDAIPNNLENQFYPKTFTAKLYNKTLTKDSETIANPKYTPGVPFGLTQF